MTTPPEQIALDALVGGRIEAVHANLETGLIALGVYMSESHWLGLGMGPRVEGVGWLPRSPSARSAPSHALIAAVKAHLVGHRVLHVAIDDDGRIWIAAGGADITARLGVLARRRGEAVVIGPSGNVLVRWPYPERTHDSSPARIPADLHASGAAMLETSERAAAEILRSALTRGIKRKLAALDRRVAAVRTDLARLSQVETLQKTGRLLLTQGHSVPRGAARATLEDWESGGTLEVALDPSRPAKAQAETFFDRARRFQRGAAAMQHRLDQTESQQRTLRALLDEVALTTEHDTLDRLAVRVRVEGIATQSTAPTRSGQRVAPRKPYQTFRDSGDRNILVGRGAEDNDELTTRHARPHDLWLHAKGDSGAHVVVPLEKGTSCPPDLLVDAATLAAHFSDARGESVVDVAYTERRYVRKPKGSAKGAVVVDREKVIAVRVEPERLQRLLDHKIE